jgi:hypothetical protein
VSNHDLLAQFDAHGSIDSGSNLASMEKFGQVLADQLWSQHWPSLAGDDGNSALDGGIN